MNRRDEASVVMYEGGEDRRGERRGGSLWVNTRCYALGIIRDV